ncbi:MAG: glycosyltransferase [Thiotrichales bacterium]
MHILMISDVYFPRINGVSTSIQTFWRCLESAGHQVTLIAPGYPGSEREDEPALVRVSSRGVWGDPEDRMMKRGAFQAVARDLQRDTFDLLHIQTPFLAHYWGVPLARELGIPIVESYHTFFEEYFYHYIPFLPKSWLKFAARFFTRRECRQVDALVAPSSPMLEVLREYGVETLARIIPTGLDMARFSSGDGISFRQSLGIAPDKPLLVHVGRLAHEKNIPFLIYMFKQVKAAMPDAGFLIAGEGPAVPSLRKLIAELDLEDSVYLLGYLDRVNELPACYRAGDVFVFASRTETQGLVLLEAMACGTPVVSTAVMGTREIMGAEQGGLVAKEDLEDFSSQVLRLLQDKALRSRLASEAHTYAEQWSDRAQTEVLLELYQEVLEGVGKG